MGMMPCNPKRCLAVQLSNQAEVLRLPGPFGPTWSIMLGEHHGWLRMERNNTIIQWTNQYIDHPMDKLIYRGIPFQFLRILIAKSCKRTLC